MSFTRRTLLKWLGISGAAVAGEIVLPAAELISLPSEELVLPANYAPAFQYDGLINRELAKLDQREFHKAFVVPGIAQMLQLFKQLPEQPEFLNAADVKRLPGQDKITFTSGKVFILERSFSPVYGQQASLFAMVRKTQ